MKKRELNIEINKFPKKFSGNFIFNHTSQEYLKKIEIDLDELCAKFLIEEYDDYNPVKFYGQFPALNYLIENVSEFKFQGGHPGASKDPRKENSRILGQTICRYFVEKAFNTSYIANIGTLLNRKLPADYEHISVTRSDTGDTPDFLFMDNKNKPCLAEAKGTRTAVKFGDAKFDNWREQFDRVSIKINDIKIEVKGYITELAIANEDNKMQNSTLYIEDPKLEGEIYGEGKLEELIKMAHYERILSNTYLDFIGNSLLSNEKLPKENNFEVEVFTIKGFESISDQEIVSLNDFNWHYNDRKFIGIEISRLRKLISLAKGEKIDLYEKIKVEKFNSVFYKFDDGFIVCNPKILMYKGRVQI